MRLVPSSSPCGIMLYGLGLMAFQESAPCFLWLRESRKMNSFHRQPALFFLALAALLLPAGLLHAQSVVITEFLAENRDGILDEDGESPDWIEIQNQGAAAVDLEGWYLSDDANELQRWRFPRVEILPGDYLLVFASGKDRAEAGSELHTNFRLEGNGEFLGLVDGAGFVCRS